MSGHSDKMEFGYKQFMGEIYGDNILFSDGKFIFMHPVSYRKLCM